MTLFGLVRKVIAAPKSAVLQSAIVFGAIVFAAGLRWVIDKGASGAPFVTFLPVVVLAAILLQWPFAVLAALASLVSVVTLFGETARIQFNVANYILWSAFAFIASFMIVVGHVLRQTILELHEQTERVRGFNAELQHRTKNTLQIVRALASRAARTTDPAEFYQSLSGRLDALAKANALLGSASLSACALDELVKAAMQPFTAWAIHAGGPDCVIEGDAGMQLAMALHELGTNAAKYGAMSADGGTVSITWTLGRETVEIRWQEDGGPPVAPPVKRGLGSRILSPGGALRSVELDYRPAGVVCRIELDPRGR